VARTRPEMQQPPMSPQQQAAAQARYQEVAKALHATAKRRFPNRPFSQIKFVQVDTPPGVVGGQPVNLTGAIDGEDVRIVVPAGARVGRQFEVPYIRFDDGGDDDVVVGEPFFVSPPILTPREADEEAARQLVGAWLEEHAEGEPPDPAMFRDRGNAAFKAKAYRDAARLYGAAVLACLHRVKTQAPLSAGDENARDGDVDAENVGDERRREAQLQKQRQLALELEMHVAYANHALALLKLRPPRAEEALEHTESALNISPDYVKALVRAGQSLQEVGR
jgi:hypothetical protein